MKWPTIFVVIACAMVVTSLARCYKGDPGYGLCSPDDETCTEARDHDASSGNTRKDGGR